MENPTFFLLFSTTTSKKHAQPPSTSFAPPIVQPAAIIGHETISTPTFCTFACGHDIAPARNALRELPHLSASKRISRRHRGKAHDDDDDDDRRRESWQTEQQEIAARQSRNPECVHRSSMPSLAENRMEPRRRFVGRARSRGIFWVFERH
mmetsp:Transcript_31179/g.62548  ORF Transcript_31179/g.62548 Transcript_31179/m.62548 type:complete len:151 (-) Transcript_31179:64-516(-)